MHMFILEQGNAFGNRLRVQSGLSLCSLKLKGHRNQPLHDFGNGKHTIIGSLNHTQPSTVLPASIYKIIGHAHSAEQMKGWSNIRPVVTVT